MTAKPSGKNLGGRPEAVIDWTVVDDLLEIQCTGEEIAGVLKVSYDSLERHCKKDKKERFADYSAKKRQGGKASLRRRQWNLAETNPAMAIFLGKNLLGQADKHDHDHNHTFPERIRIEFVKSNIPAPADGDAS